MGFKILNAEGEVIAKNELNKEAAQMLGVEYNEDSWSSHIIIPPLGKTEEEKEAHFKELDRSIIVNWHNKLQMCSEYLPYKDFSGWDEARSYLRTSYFKSAVWDASIEDQLDYYKYISELIKPIDDIFVAWIKKGYKIKFL